MRIKIAASRMMVTEQPQKAMSASSQVMTWLAAIVLWLAGSVDHSTMADERFSTVFDFLHKDEIAWDSPFRLKPVFSESPVDMPGDSVALPPRVHQVGSRPEDLQTGIASVSGQSREGSGNDVAAVVTLIDHITAEPETYRPPFSFREDLGNAWYRLKDDSSAVLQPNNLLVLTVAAGGAIALHQDADDRVREYTARSPERWGKGSELLRNFGEIGIQVPVIASMYWVSLCRDDEPLHVLSLSLINASVINGVSTTLLKVAVNTDRPTTTVDGGRHGFPSFHTSSSFAIASVLNEHFGWQAGVPAFAVATAVAWSRIDERHHDLSDVVFGAALGYVIGTAVSRHELTGDSRVILLPWTEPSNRAVGLQWEWRY